MDLNQFVLEFLSLLPLQEPLVKHYIIGGSSYCLGLSCFIILYHWQCIFVNLEYFSQWPFVDFFMIAKENKNRVDLILQKLAVISTET
jgi:hypothetical protein